MRTSESIKEIACALSKAQAEMTGAKKTSANPYFKTKYADLASVIEAISKPYAGYGLSFVQGAAYENNMVSVTTRIMHESGEWIEETTSLPPVKADPQGVGSAISYAKRYGLQALAGVPSEDDDGNAAVARSLPPRNERPEIAGGDPGPGAQHQQLDSVGLQLAIEQMKSLDDAEEIRRIFAAAWRPASEEQRSSLKATYDQSMAKIVAVLKATQAQSMDKTTGGSA